MVLNKNQLIVESYYTYRSGQGFIEMTYGTLYFIAIAVRIFPDKTAKITSGRYETSGSVHGNNISRNINTRVQAWYR